MFEHTGCVILTFYNEFIRILLSCFCSDFVGLWTSNMFGSAIFPPKGLLHPWLQIIVAINCYICCQILCYCLPLRLTSMVFVGNGGLLMKCIFSGNFHFYQFVSLCFSLWKRGEGSRSGRSEQCAFFFNIVIFFFYCNLCLEWNVWKISDTIQHSCHHISPPLFWNNVCVWRCCFLSRYVLRFVFRDGKPQCIAVFTFLTVSSHIFVPIGSLEPMHSNWYHTAFVTPHHWSYVVLLSLQ